MIAINWRPFVSIKTTWSDDSVTKSEPLEEWFANWLLLTYSDAEFWKNQIRPVRAILVDRHDWPVKEVS